jgi:hypothetical protein
MDFWFEFLDINLNEKTKKFHDCHGFKWQNINIYPILNFIFFRFDTLLVNWIVIAPKRHKGFKNSEIEGVLLMGIMVIGKQSNESPKSYLNITHPKR